MRGLLLLLALCGLVSAFYLPGVSPRTFKKGERVKVKVNKLTSTMTMLPYDFYSLPFPKVRLVFASCRIRPLTQYLAA
jgi:transmembrane 9 superfamily protein 2/4